jgi:hypothetical protein
MSSLVIELLGAHAPVAAVIEEARRRQRRRRLLGAAGTIVVAAGAGTLFLGFRSGPPVATHDRSPAPPKTYRLFLAERSPVEIKNTISVIRRERGVLGFSFRSKADALRILKLRYPDLAAHLTRNPMSDSIDVRIESGDAPRIVPYLRRLPAVAAVKVRAAE